MRHAFAESLLGKAPLGLDDVLDFLSVIWALDHALQRSSKRMEATMGITGPQRLVIRIVGRFPGISAGHLAALLHVHPSTLTGILNRLERNGWVRRRSDPRDGRRSLTGLTDKGLSVEIETEGVIENAIRRILERTPREKIQATREVLESISVELSKAWGSDPSESAGSGEEPA
jgi:DNA-binding MarR family transcriptional regulator